MKSLYLKSWFSLLSSINLFVVYWWYAPNDMAPNAPWAKVLMASTFLLIFLFFYNIGENLNAKVPSYVILKKQFLFQTYT